MKRVIQLWRPTVSIHWKFTREQKLPMVYSTVNLIGSGSHFSFSNIIVISSQVWKPVLILSVHFYLFSHHNIGGLYSVLAGSYLFRSKSFLLMLQYVQIRCRDFFLTKVGRLNLPNIASLALIQGLYFRILLIFPIKIPQLQKNKAKMKIKKQSLLLFVASSSKIEENFLRCFDSSGVCKSLDILRIRRRNII